MLQKTNMKTKINLITILLAATFIVFTSCKKNSGGGKAEIHAKIYNKGTEINHSDLYVKFGTTEQPSDPTRNYDIMEHGEETDNHVHVEDLRPGKYYLYAIGVNTLTGKNVKGGASVEIKWKDRKNTLEVPIETVE